MRTAAERAASAVLAALQMATWSVLGTALLAAIAPESLFTPLGLVKTLIPRRLRPTFAAAYCLGVGGSLLLVAFRIAWLSLTLLGLPTHREFARCKNGDEELTPAVWKHAETAQILGTATIFLFLLPAASRLARATLYTRRERLLRRAGRAIAAIALWVVAASSSSLVVPLALLFKLSEGTEHLEQAFELLRYPNAEAFARGARYVAEASLSLSLLIFGAVDLDCEQGSRKAAAICITTGIRYALPLAVCAARSSAEAMFREASYDE
tara:strand:+ start:1064 stop:1864 length:801 start_codon:yes stop_codon:yes gene_type:complete